MGQPRKPKLQTAAPAPEDADAFRAAVQDAVPIVSNKVVPTRPRPKPVAQQRQQDDRAALSDSLSDSIADRWESGEELVYLRDGLARDVLRKLRRGHWVTQDALDLHGMTVDEARSQLTAFLSTCLKRGLRCVRIVHGKGLRSKNREPVLKKKVAGWLAQREEVLALCQARTADGGSGAVVVLLKSGSKLQD
ncbi:MAG: Smr/MutS family protein [Pseudomonadota bacterium]